MKAILTEEKSMYGLEKAVKNSNYATVWRHVKSMRDNGLLRITKTPSKRKTEIPTLTPKGLATLLIEGDLQKEELSSIGRKSFRIYFKKLPILAEPFMTDILSDSLLEIKPKVNLKFFDEKWFREVLRIAWRNSAVKAIKKYRAKFEEKGIWATEKELQENPPLLEKALEELMKSKEAFLSLDES